jgi:hypothetical protein
MVGNMLLIPHIFRLTRAIQDKPHALAIAVYSEPHNDELMPVEARSPTEFEGVACVDDAARGAVHACRMYRQYGSRQALRLALGYLQFICFMQQPNGSIVNFILDWHGTPNLTGRTSYSGGEWWFVRGMRALAVGTIEAPELCIPAFRRGLKHLTQPFDDPRVQAIAVLALLAARRSLGVEVDRACRTASQVLARQIESGELKARAWLWGEIQEGVLASAALKLGDSILGKLALESAAKRFSDVEDKLNFGATIIPYDASSVAWSCRKLYQLSRDPVWLSTLATAVSWFDGHNSAGAAVYDRKRGLVYDGICDGVVSANSGAEANIEGAETLLESVWLKGVT